MLILALIAAAQGAPEAGKTMAWDDWHNASVIAVGGDPATGAPVLHLRATGDLDGDGAPDEAYLKLACAGGTVKDAQFHSVKSPRDSATGQATGKRTHGSVTFVKEWGPSTPQLSAIKPTYDIKKVEGTGARTVDSEWVAVTLGNADGLCTAAEDALAKITKSRSNIQNN
ncbi:MAG: hypothetical protein ABIS38_09185 [Sphingomicrobium sp.]